MRRVLICSAVVGFIAAAFSMSDAPRATGSDPTITLPPIKVQVTNFPAVQAVSGSVNVANQPTVNLAPGSSVAVSSLPAVQVSSMQFDSSGNLKVTGSSSSGAGGS